MNDDNLKSPEQTNRPGKRRTWWHPLLVRLLKHLMATAYEVRDEELVGRMPLRVDIVLIRRELGHLSPAAVRDLGALVPLLNRFTLVEFKGPTDALEPGDLAQLIGCAFLWHSQQMKALKGADCGPLLSYALQQIEQFVTLGEDFAMQHAETEYLGEWTEDLKTAVLELIPSEDRLRGLSPEQRMSGLTQEERLRGLPPEERLRGLTAEELDRLRELLERKREG